MPIESSIRNGMVCTELMGEINYDITCQHIDFIASLKPRIQILYELTDFTNVTGVNLTDDDMQKIGYYLEQSKGTYPHSYIAYYVVNDFQFGMARMFQIHMELADHPMVIQVFRDKEEALQFLKDAMKKHG